MAITLKQINENNISSCLELKLRDGQDIYVTEPATSLAYAYVYRKQSAPFGIFNDNTLVGLVTVYYDYEMNEYSLRNIMIDGKYQHRGFGSEAMECVFDFVRLRVLGPSLRITALCHKDNVAAIGMFTKLGFKETGNVFEGRKEFSITPEE